MNELIPCSWKGCSSEYDQPVVVCFIDGWSQVWYDVVRDGEDVNVLRLICPHHTKELRQNFKGAE